MRVLRRAWMARCNSCKAPRLIPAGSAATMRYGKPDPRCACGSTMSARLIKGTVTEAPCNAKCEASKGHVCECACGGKNHGAAHV